jgi:hypothetical protein
MNRLEGRVRKIERTAMPPNSEVGVQLLLSIQGTEEQRMAADRWLAAHQIEHSSLGPYLAGLSRVRASAVARGGAP